MNVLAANKKLKVVAKVKVQIKNQFHM